MGASSVALVAMPGAMSPAVPLNMSQIRTRPTRSVMASRRPSALKDKSGIRCWVCLSDHFSAALSAAKTRTILPSVLIGGCDKVARGTEGELVHELGSPGGDRRSFVLPGQSQTSKVDWPAGRQAFGRRCSRKTFRTGCESAREGRSHRQGRRVPDLDRPILARRGDSPAVRVGKRRPRRLARWPRSVRTVSPEPDLPDLDRPVRARPRRHNARPG